MKNKNDKNRRRLLAERIRPALLLSALSLLFTILVRFADVKAIGPNGSSVGFASLNEAVRDLIGVHVVWYHVSQTLGYLAILLALLFAVIGALQLIRRKGLGKVDPEILSLGGLYAATVLLYVFFEKFVVNYRPVLENGVLEPSYPSSHTMLSLVVFGSAFFLIRRYFYPGPVQKRLIWADLAFLALTVLTRLLSGFHWLTDIIGGILIASALLAWFGVLLVLIRRPKA